MAESIVQDWLADSDSLISEHATDPDIAEAIFTLFHERQRHETLIHDICQQLLAFYRANEDETLHKFPLQFIPVLIYTYLHAVAAGDKKAARDVETLVICIYNGEVSTEDDKQRVLTFRMPILAQASVYHEEKNLPLADLRRWEENSNRLVTWGPHASIESINAQNRMRVMTALLFCYNQQVNLTQKSALIHLCRVASQMVNQGFVTKTGLSHRISYGSDTSTSTPTFAKSATPRIPLSSSFLLELVHAIYFAMFNGFGTVAIQTLEDIHNRACYEMYADLILVTNAIRNSLHANPSGQPCDGPMGLSVALTPSTSTSTTAVSKSMITNASFRTKKLPDDIPIQVQDLTMPQAPLQHQLASVSEEPEQTAKDSPSSKESQSTRNSIIRPSMEGIKAQAQKALIAGFKKATKDREKDKDGKSAEPPKPPQRKFDKYSQQRNSLLQADTSIDFERSPLSGVKLRAYETLELAELPSTVLLNESVNNNNSRTESELNDTTCMANSLSGSEMLTKSFDASIDPLTSITSNGTKHGVAEHVHD